MTFAKRKKILKWYHANGRDFPWRHTYDPYRIMIAEFMLHRTRAEQVVPVFNDFITKYPDINSLANARVKSIKKFTESLGLHWRYKHFIESAQYIINELNGKFPEDTGRLKEIPGVGEYISAAISIIAFKKSAPVVDSNIARFFNRFYSLNLGGEIRRKNIIQEMSEKFFKSKSCRELLFAIIDFCALICKAYKPLCDQCTINKECGYYLSAREFQNNIHRKTEFCKQMEKK